MAQSGRERVTRSLTFACPDRVPREMWLLPWTRDRFPLEIADILRWYPSDFDDAPNVYRPSPRVKGDLFGVGEHTDEWGCRITNIEAGLAGC